MKLMSHECALFMALVHRTLELLSKFNFSFISSLLSSFPFFIPSYILLPLPPLHLCLVFIRRNINKIKFISKFNR